MRAPRFRICRVVGDRTINVGLPAMRIDALTLSAADAETALANAKRLVVDARNLIAIPEAN